MATAIVINRTQMGEGDEALGQKILGTCLRKSVVFEDLEAVILYNAGVKLATRNSVVAPELHQLRERGTDVLVCGTCVDHYGLRDRLLFDPPSNMDEILAAIRKATKVITL
jgi:hypothetical protein